MAINLEPSSSLTGDLEPMMEMNTTPLIDVMLVLLVMLIITIPLNMHAVNIELPGNKSADQNVQPPKVEVRVTAIGQIKWNGSLVTKEQYETYLMSANANPTQPEIHFYPEPGAKYEKVMNAMASAQRVGLTKIGLPEY
jgi:biopolymer transport protein ExbD